MGKTFNTRNPAPMGVSEKWLDQRDDELRAAADGYVDDVPEIQVLPSVIDSPTYQALLRTVTQLRRQVEDLAEENERLRAQRSAQPKKPRDTDPDKKPRRRRAAEVQHTPDGDYYPIRLVAEQKGMNQSSVSRQRFKLGINAKYFGGIQHIHADDLSKINKSEKAKRKR